LVTLGLALFAGAIPGLLVTFLSTQSPETMTETGPAFWTIAVLALVGGMIVSSITQAFLTRATVAYSQGRRASLAESARAGLAVFLPLMGLSLVIAVATAFGMLLLIIPGLMLMTAWSVATPALIEERVGIFEAIERSNELTRGSRWRIFFLMVAVGLVTWVTTVAVQFFTGVDEAEAIAAFANVPYLAASILVGTLNSLLIGTVQSAIYVELRSLKDGPATNRLEQIFA
jgi:uncharacterized membrane protein